MIKRKSQTNFGDPGGIYMTHELRKYNQDLVKSVSNINIPIHKPEAKVKVGRKN